MEKKKLYRDRRKEVILVRRSCIETISPQAFDDQLERRYQIYMRPYISQREAAYLLGISPQTFAKQVKEMNAKKETIRILKRIGIPIDDIVKAFRLEADRDRVCQLRQQKTYLGGDHEERENTNRSGMAEVDPAQRRHLRA